MELLKKLTFFKKSEKDEIREIRREDFKQLFNKLKKIQKEGSDWFSIQVIPGKISLLSLAQEQLNFTMVKSRKYPKLRDMANEFFEQARKDILQKKYIHKTIQRYRSLMQQHETELGNFLKVSNEYGKIVLTGESYKVISFIMKTFLKRSAVAAGLSQTSDLFTKAGHIHQGRGEKNKTSPFPEKIRRVLVLTNFSGEKLEYLHENKAFWDEGFPRYAWRHVSGIFSQKRMLSLIEDEKIFRNNDLIIYRGHALVRNGSIHWILKDNEISLSPYHISHYIHFSCLHFQKFQDDMSSLPFREAVLPLSYFRDRDESELIRRIFHFLNNGRSFRDACLEAFQENKESPLFSYWFS